LQWVDEPRNKTWAHLCREQPAEDGRPQSEQPELHIFSACLQSWPAGE